MNYKILAKIMNDYFNNKTFHSPLDVVIQNSKIVNKKYFYPCEIQQSICIDNHSFVFHHYGCKYDDIILYFPGGSFIDPPTMLHYKFAKRLSKRIKKHIIMVQYPMYPEVDPYEIALLIIRIIKAKNYKNISLMGDSAGANLAAIVLACLHSIDKDYVKHIILISPLTNRLMNNCKMMLIKDYDFILNQENLKSLVNDVYFLNPSVNKDLFPEHNDFKYKTNTMILSGEKEIVTPDIRLYCQQNKTLNLKHLIYKDMCHCFILIKCKQSKNAINKIDNFLKIY